MKILIDARLYGLENAGLGRYAMNLVSELADIDKKNKYTILLRRKYYDSLKMPKNWEKVLADFRHYSVAEQLRLPKLISSNDPDLVHFLHFNVPLAIKRKYIVTIHDILMHKQKGREVTTLTRPIYLGKRVGYKLTFRKAVKGAAKIIVPSTFAKTEVIKEYKINQEKVIVTYEGVNRKFSPKRSKHVLRKYKLTQPYFVYVGNAYKHKNLERAVEAIVALNQKQDKKVIFAIASARNVFTKKLEEIVEKHNAKDYVKLLGFVPDELLGSLYEQSAAFLYPSISEGFGLQGLEAMVAETLVLASDIPVFKEVYKSAATYFNPFDFTSIQNALQDALNLDFKKRDSIIKISKKHALTYSWSRMAEQTLEVYKSLT